MLTPDVAREDLWGSFSAGHIATGVVGAITVDSNESGDIARQRLEDKRFDQAPVVFQGRVVGWVATSQLEDDQLAKSVMTPLDKCAIVSAESSLPNVLQLLCQNRLVFTVGADGLSGFVVPSDLDRHAVRGYFYLLVASIEMLLSEIVRSASSDVDAVALMGQNMKKRFDQACKANIETNPVEYLYIRQLIELFLRTPYSKESSLWSETLTEQLNMVKTFRNSVMHPASSIAATTGPDEAAEFARCAQEVAARLHHIVINALG